MGACRLEKEKRELIKQIRDILVELLDVTPAQVMPDRYLVRDLGMESIDFLELAVVLNQRFEVPVNDDVVFLRNMRIHLAAAGESGQDPLAELKRQYAFLSEQRLLSMINDLDAGPVIQVQDLVSYLQWQMNATKAA